MRPEKHAGAAAQTLASGRPPSAGQQALARYAAHLAWLLSLLLLLLNLTALWLILGWHGERDVWTLIYPGITTIALLYPIVGAFLAAHRPHNLTGWLMIGMGASGAISLFAQGCAVYSAANFAIPPPPIALLSWLATWLWLASFILFPLLLLYFPDGRLPGRGWRWLLPLLVLSWGMLLGRAIISWPERASLPVLDGSALDAAVDATGGFWGVVMDLSALLLFVVYLAAILSLVVRYRQARATERLQIKWFAFFGSTAVLVQIGSVLLVPYGGYLSGNLRQVVFAALQAVGFAGIALAIGVAILRYRLYDIDVIIRKTLVYSALTTFLALVYVGVVALVQLVLAVSGQQSQLAIVASTLVIAALFTPVRRRIQNNIDRRFYRRNYDARQVLVRFAEAARAETDPDRLTSELIDVVQETMQPATVGLWLREEWIGLRRHHSANDR
jgi:hypothetical protein